jgi:hypothetical protein
MLCSSPIDTYFNCSAIARLSTWYTAGRVMNALYKFPVFEHAGRSLVMGLTNITAQVWPSERRSKPDPGLLIWRKMFKSANTAVIVFAQVKL